LQYATATGADGGHGRQYDSKHLFAILDELMHFGLYLGGEIPTQHLTGIQNDFKSAKPMLVTSFKLGVRPKCPLSGSISRFIVAAYQPIAFFQAQVNRLENKVFIKVDINCWRNRLTSRVRASSGICICAQVIPCVFKLHTLANSTLKMMLQCRNSIRDMQIPRQPASGNPIKPKVQTLTILTLKAPISSPTFRV
jgi:hypothetical protein